MGFQEAELKPARRTGQLSVKVLVVEVLGEPILTIGELRIDQHHSQDAVPQAIKGF